MSGRAFTSVFAGDLEAYLAFKQSMGHRDTARIWYLRQFDAWCNGHDRTVFDQATVEEWVATELERSGRRSSWPPRSPGWCTAGGRCRSPHLLVTQPAARPRPAWTARTSERSRSAPCASAPSAHRVHWLIRVL
jgi:hypothetical protein